MSTSVFRTADAWWVSTPSGAAKVDTRAATTAQLLADRQAIAAAAASTDTVPVERLALVSPVTAPCRVIAQMTNFASHVKDSGLNPETVPLAFFRKASGSISGPYDDVIRPGHVRLLDYEVEIGLVIGRQMPVGTTITADTLTSYVAGLVVTNDISARDLQLPKTQFYEAKSYPGLPPAPASASGRACTRSATPAAPPPTCASGQPATAGSSGWRPAKPPATTATWPSCTR